jgi:class 3 adenylate cyclase
VPGPTQEFRIVTVVFCDVVRSTDLERQLDPMPMQRLLDRYGQAVRLALADRGGASVGKRHGDGFMAAFGVPELHEDDALRAVRSAGELRVALDELSKEVRQQRGLEFHVRLGINTGNVLVRDAGTLEEELTGTPVNPAKRFEEAAGAGEILMGEETYRLVADAVKAEPAGPLTVKGAAEPQNVWRLLEVLPDRPGRARRPAAPMVGRGREQELLLRLLERAAAERTCHLVSVLGTAGVGKSRLVDEFVAGLGDQAAVLRGHCPAFGDSVTLWPMVEVVRQAAGIAPDDGPEQARSRLAELLGGELDDAAVAGGDEQLHRALGEDVHAVARLVLGEHALAGLDDPLGDVLGDAPPRRLVDAREQLGPGQDGGPVLEVHVGRRSYAVPPRPGASGEGWRCQQPDSRAVGAWTADRTAAPETADTRSEGRDRKE